MTDFDDLKDDICKELPSDTFEDIPDDTFDDIEIAIEEDSKK